MFRQSNSLRFVRDLLALLLTFCLLSATLPARTAASANVRKPAPKLPLVQGNSGRHKQGQLIVKFRSDSTAAQRAAVIETLSKDQKQLRGNGKLNKLILKDGLSVDSAAQTARQLDAVVEFAEPDYIVSRAGLPTRLRRQLPPTPNDPQFAGQWALKNTGQGGGVPGSDIGVPAGWQTTTGSADTIIAVIDTGIDARHRDLSGNLWVNKREANGRNNEDDDRDGYVDDVNGWNFVNDTANVNDDHGHGTAVAGIIGAQGNNGLGVTGVMWKASILPLKALDSTGSGAISDVVEAIDFAIAHGAAVINCSFGTEGFSQSLLDAINRAAMAGVLVVASAGNNGWDLAQTPYYPASYTASNLISVAATTNGDLLAPFSNYGANQVQIAAPGIDVLTTYPNNQYVTLTGTSASAPLVAGVAGLLKTIRGWVSAQSVRTALLEGARKVPALNGKVTSQGVVSAGEAIAVFAKNNGGGGSGGSGGTGGNPGGPKGDPTGNPGGNPPGGGQASGINIDYMRNNTPQRAEPRVMVNNIPPDTYDDPVPSGSSDDYYAAASQPGNQVGRSNSTVGRVGDPTIGNSATVAQSITLGSQNINFTLPVLSLGGRGPAFDLALSYNSRVWITDPWSGKLTFNSDRGVPAPGWRIGFGWLQGASASGTSIPPFVNREVGNKYTYIWVEPDGTRRTLVGTTSSSNNIYTSNDSTNIEYNKATGILRLADGTQIKFTTPTSGGVAIGNEMLPIEIKDRNGNYITITNAAIPNGRWAIDYITDTLGREIDFYYENGFLREVRQVRGATTRVFVRLSYAAITMQRNFTGVTVDAPANGQQVWEPWFIEFPDQVNYRFFYTSYIQAYQIEKWVPTIGGQGAGRIIAYTWYDLPSMSGQSLPAGPIRSAGNNSSAQTACPKFATREEWAENWRAASDTIGWQTDPLGNSIARYSYYFSGAGYGSFTRITDPLGRIYRTDVSADGLTHINRVWTNATDYGSDTSLGTPLKTTTTTYGSDASGVRVTDVTTTDGGNTKKTLVSYTTVAGVSLPYDVTEYDNNGASVYRHTVTNYVTDTTYSNLHIFGLPRETLVYKGAGLTNLIARSEYFYDETAYFDTSGFSVIQHDGSGYGTGFVTGRGNVTTVKQYEIPGAGSRNVTRTKYDKTGMVVSVTDAANNTGWFYYDDNFSDAVNRNTHALVTKTKDPDGYWNGTKYNWYTGAPVESYHIAATSGTGATQNVTTYGYDGFDRLNAVSRPDGGDTIWAYWDNWLAVGVYTEIDAGLTQYSFTAYNGAGSMRWQGADNLSGVSGKYRARIYEFDVVGRNRRTSLETAVDGGMTAIDDDSVAGGGAGILYREITYNALDRQTQIKQADTNTIKFDYVGCGCAGTQTVTTEDERGKKRRQIFDTFGRLAEAQELDVTNPGSPTVYSRAKYVYDERDLLQRIEHSGANASHYQQRTFTYDAYGRLSNQTTPEAGTISYTYKPHDLVDTVTDARGLSVTFNYNGRKQVKDVLYSDATPDVFYDYGEYGERLWMQEKNSGGVQIARTDYGYDSYKRLTSETRQFNGLGGTYLVEYDYNLVDALKWVKYTVNSWVRQVNYSYNFAGGTSSIGTDLVSIAGKTTANNIAGGFAYRGFGGVKQMDYGNGQRLTANYSFHRQQMTSLTVQKPTTSDPVYGSSYDYYNGGNNNGRIQKVTDGLDGSYTTTYSYDHYNRLASASATAYSRSYSYDAWGNLRTVSGSGGTNPNYTLSYAQDANGVPLTNRIANAGYTYDNAGNQTNDGWTSYSYDAANRLKTASGGNSYDYDGDGRRVKQTNSSGTVFYLWSSVLNQPVAEIDGTYTSLFRAYAFGPGGQSLAVLSYDGNFYWVHSDHLGSGRKLTNTSGVVVYRGEYDPHGQMILETGAGTFFNSRKFTGYERDWATGLDYARARTYQSARGKFMQADPLGLAAADVTNPQSLNLYGYVENDPANFTDPSGLNKRKCLVVTFTCVNDGISGRECGYDWYWDDCEEGSTGSTGGGGQGGGGGGGGNTSKEPCGQPTWEQVIGPNGIHNQLLNPLGVNQSWTGKEFKYEQNVKRTYSELSTKLIEEGWEGFSTDPHYKHWGDDDYRKQYKGEWYHLSVKRPGSTHAKTGTFVLNPNTTPTGFGLHWEEDKPGSVSHFINFLASTRFGIPIEKFRQLPPCK